MATSSASVNSFLTRRKAERGGIHTHTRIPDTNTPEESGIWGGSYNIIDKDLPKLYKFLAQKIFVDGKKEYLTECQLPDAGPILIDLDFRYSTDITDKQHDSGFIDDVVDRYFENIKKLINIPEGEEIPVYIFEKPNVNILEDKTKDGIHIIIGIKMTYQEQLLLRKEVLKDFNQITESLPIIDGWTVDDIIDPCIPKGKTNWQMYGSRKPFNEAYILIAANKMSFDDDGDLEQVSIIEELNEIPKEELLYKLSARNNNHKSFEATQYNKSNVGKNKPKKKKNRKRRNVNIVLGINSAARYEDITNSQELDAQLKVILDDPSKEDYHLKETHDYTMILGERYYNPYEAWVKVGWALHNTDHRLFLTWVKFSSKSDKFDYNTIGEMYSTWNEMRDEGLSSRSLMWWALQEDEAKFEIIKKQTIDYYVDITVVGRTDYDIAMVLYQLFKDRFKCASHRNKIWYEFTGPLWNESEEGTALRRKLSNKLASIYFAKIHAVKDKAGEGMSQTEHDSMVTTCKSLTIISQALRNTSSKNNIMKEAQEIFYENGFQNKLDVNPMLLGCKNGIIDFDKGEFREGQPEDYLSMSTHINYVPLDRNDSEQNQIQKEIHDFMTKLFPQEDLRKYMWEHLASCLIGTNDNQTFNIYTGCGRNGKSKLVELMSMILGDYKKTVPITMITQKRTGIGSASPEIAQLKGCRYAVMQEPCKQEKINEGIMKEITGGDPIQGRTLYKDTVTFIPQFNLVVCTNTLFDIKSNDDGTWRRIRVCDFISKFVKDPSGDPNDHEYLIDKNIANNFKKWAPVFFGMLVDIAFKTKGKVEDCDIVMASANKYRASQDYLTEFFNERIVENSEQRLLKTVVYNDFRIWYTDNHGKGVPKGKELYEFLDKRLGKYKGGWKGYTLQEEEESDEIVANSAV